MDMKSKTIGNPSSDLFNYTAPINEYLSCIQDNTVIYTPSLNLVRTIRIYPNYNEFKPLIEDEFIAIKLKKSTAYLDYVKRKEEKSVNNFASLLDNFLNNYFIISEYKPLRCILEMFNFPGEDYSEPMIKMIFPDFDDFNNLEIKDNIEQEFLKYLVQESKNINEFRDYKKILKNFRFVIRSE